MTRMARIFQAAVRILSAPSALSAVQFSSLAILLGLLQPGARMEIRPLPATP